MHSMVVPLYSMVVPLYSMVVPMLPPQQSSHHGDLARVSGGGRLTSGGYARVWRRCARVWRPRLWHSRAGPRPTASPAPALARVQRARQWRRHAPPRLATSLESGGHTHGDLLGVHGESGGYAHGVGGAEEESCSTNPPPPLLTRGWPPLRQGQAASAEAARYLPAVAPPVDLPLVTKKRRRRSRDETKEGSQCSLVSSP
jgi:hypothetical protein